jgi:hypothetical protein
VRVTAVDHGLFAALDRSNHVEQQMLLDQRSEVLEQLLLDRLLFRLRGFGRRVLARRATIGLDILVEANETSCDACRSRERVLVRQRLGRSIPCK